MTTLPVNKLSLDEVLTDGAEHGAIPTLPQRTAAESAPRIEYRTLAQRLDGDHALSADDALNRALNDDDAPGWSRWDVFQIGDGRPIERVCIASDAFQIWRTVVLFRVSDDGEDAPQPVKAAAEATVTSGASLLFERVVPLDTTKPITIVITPATEDAPKPDDTQIVVPITEPVLAETQPHMATMTRERLRAEDFAFLTATEINRIEQ